MEPKIQEKAWNPELELEIIKQWEDSRLYQFNPQEKNFTIDTPPPYPSGRCIDCKNFFLWIKLIKARISLIHRKKILQSIHRLLIHLGVPGILVRHLIIHKSI